MAEKVEFELVSPEALLLSQPVDMVVVPGGEGYYGVLLHHIPMITTVKAGTIQIFEENRIVDRIFVTGGFAEVTDDRVTVLVDSAIPVSGLDRSEIEKSIADLGEDLEDATEDDERAAINVKLYIARAKLEAIAEAGGSTH
jgi:F-type H+-transporting ATPase subunit epsilon